MQPKSSIQVNVMVSGNSDRSIIDTMLEQLQARHPEVAIEFRNGGNSDGQPLQAAIQNWVSVIYRHDNLN